MAFIPLIAGALAAGGTAAAGGSLATALTVGGAAVSGIGAMQSAQYQAAVAENNSKIASENALRAANQTQLQSQRTDNQYAATMGQQKAAYAGANLDTSQGSPMSIFGATQRNQAISTSDIYQSGAAKVQGFQQQSADYAGEAEQDRTKGWMDLAGAAINAATPFAKKGWQSTSLVGGSKSTNIGGGLFGGFD